jgi:hypothetical protein
MSTEDSQFIALGGEDSHGAPIRTGFLTSATTIEVGADLFGTQVGINAKGSNVGISGLGTGSDKTFGIGVSGFGSTGVRGEGSQTGVSGDGSLDGVGVSGVSQIGTGVTGFGGTGVRGAGNQTGVIGSATSNKGEVSMSGFLGGTDPQFKRLAGVYGESPQQGVMGLTTDPSGTGVYGGGRTTANGAQIGVRGETWTGTGVQGTSFGSGVGVQGTSNVVGVQGTSLREGTGVQGTSDLGTGVQGTSRTGVGVAANTSSSLAPALSATNDVGGPAALFVGAVEIEGGFLVFGGSKSAAVPHPDGSHRLLYCMESPESWFEDFGEGKLTHGKVEVRLDPDFAALVEVDGYQVFITPYGESNGLFVAERNAVSFRVCEQQGGTSNASFAFRVVAKRKDIVADRLARVDPPSRRSVGPH